MESSNEIKKLANVIIFDPEHWSQYEKFINFASSTHNFSPETETALRGVNGHFEKYNISIRNAKLLKPKLIEDMEELYKSGYSERMRSKEMATIIDAIYCELYSVLDCIRQVVCEIYNKYRGANVGKTSRLFTNAKKKIIDERVPLEIRNALSEAYDDWFPLLRDIRVSVTRSNVGSCHYLENEVSYMILPFGKNIGNEIKINNIFEEVMKLAHKVYAFSECIFEVLNKNLNNVETPQLCGVFQGRFFQRLVKPDEAIDFNNGRCLSYKWFEKNENPTCPFMSTCGAYKASLDKRI